MSWLVDGVLAEVTFPSLAIRGKWVRCKVAIVYSIACQVSVSTGSMQVMRVECCRSRLAGRSWHVQTAQPEQCCTTHPPGHLFVTGVVVWRNL